MLSKEFIQDMIDEGYTMKEAIEETKKIMEIRKEKMIQNSRESEYARPSKVEYVWKRSSAKD